MRPAEVQFSEPRPLQRIPPHPNRTRIRIAGTVVVSTRRLRVRRSSIREEADEIVELGAGTVCERATDQNVVLSGAAGLIYESIWTRYLGLFYLQDSGELTVFCLAMVGALIGFLWFNTHPAQVFMGDTGSLALGGALGVVAILLKSEFVLAFVGAVFVAEMISVILQRFVFKYRKKRYGLEYAQAHRVFRRAPLHHHFEMIGWKETQVVVRFWIIGILCAFFALSTLKLR
jgi:phospho-N-acetylmuramoyl-pentapeptide-transferase